MTVVCVHTSEPFFNIILEMGRSIPARKCWCSLYCVLGFRCVQVCSFAVLSLPSPHRLAPHRICILACAVCLLRFSFPLDAQKVGTVGFGGRSWFFLIVIEDGSCERTLGFRNARDRCTLLDLRWRWSREQKFTERFRHQECGPDHGTSVFLPCIFLLIQ